MATYIKTLKEDNGDIIYPQTKGSAVLLDGGSDLESVLATKADASTVNQKITVGDVQSTDIVANAVTTAKIANSNVTTAKLANGAVTSAKIDWSTLDGSETGWVYLGQTKLTSEGASVLFNFPAQYNNYKILFAGEFSSGSDTWIDLRLLNGSTPLVGSQQTQDVYGTAWTGEIHENIPFLLNAGGCYQYETVNIDFYSLKTVATQWRKFQGHLYKTGNSYAVRTSNGRLSSATEPTAVEILTGGRFGAGSVLKVWASNNT